MILGLDHIRVVVPDPQASRARVASLLGAQPDLLRFEAGDATPAADRLRIRGATHICIQHRDMNHLASALKGAGWHAIAAPTDLGGSIRYQYAEDGDGLIVEAESVDRPADAPPALAHVALATPDRDRLCDWYAELLGTTPRRSPRIGPNAKIDRLTGMTAVEVSGAWLPAGELEIEFWTYHTPPVVDGSSGPLRGLVFRSDDVAGDAARLGFASVEDRAEGCDPDGNPVVLVAA